MKGRAHPASSDFDDKTYAELVAERYRTAERWRGYTITVEPSGRKWFIAAEKKL